MGNVIANLIVDEALDYDFLVRPHDDVAHMSVRGLGKEISWVRTRRAPVAPWSRIIMPTFSGKPEKPTRLSGHFPPSEKRSKRLLVKASNGHARWLDSGTDGRLSVRLTLAKYPLSIVSECP